MSITLTTIPHIPMITSGDDLAHIIADAMIAFDFGLQPFDILVVAQKIVSKSEGRAIRLSEVTPSPRALELAKSTQLVDAWPTAVPTMVATSAGHPRMNMREGLWKPTRSITFQSNMRRVNLEQTWKKG